MKSIIEMIQEELASVTDRDLASMERKLRAIATEGTIMGTLHSIETRKLLTLTTRHILAAEKLSLDLLMGDDDKTITGRALWEKQLSGALKELFWLAAKAEMLDAGVSLEGQLQVSADWAVVRADAVDEAEILKRAVAEMMKSRFTGPPGTKSPD